jgi:hypothetical protein
MPITLHDVLLALIAVGVWIIALVQWGVLGSV